MNAVLSNPLLNTSVVGVGQQVFEGWNQDFHGHLRGIEEEAKGCGQVE